MPLKPRIVGMENTSVPTFDPSRLTKASAADYSSSDTEDEDDHVLPGVDVTNDFGDYNPRKKRRLAKNGKEKAALGIFGSDSDDDRPGQRWRSKTLRRKGVSFISTDAQDGKQDSSIEDEPASGGEDSISSGNNDDDDAGIGLGFKKTAQTANGPRDHQEPSIPSPVAAAKTKYRKSTNGRGFVPSVDEPVLNEEAIQPPIRNKPQPSAFNSKGKVNASSFGARMMAKMGFVDGKGLGKDGNGRNVIIEANLRPQGVGLGAVKEKTESERKEEKRQARLRGEVVIDSDEEEKRQRKAKKMSRGIAGRSASSTPRRQKTKYITAEELKAAAPGLQIPDAFAPILDMTGPEGKLITSTSGVMTPGGGVVESSEVVEARKLVKRAHAELMAFSEEWRSLEERKSWLGLELREREQEVEDLRSDLERLQSLSTLIAEQLTQASDWDEVVACLDKTMDLGAVAPEAADVAVAAIHPFFKGSDWKPLEEPAKFASDMKRLSSLFAKSSTGDGGQAINKWGSQAAKAGGVYRQHRKATTSYESMMYKNWLPRVLAGMREWDALTPGPMLSVVEEWDGAMPPFVRAQVMDGVARKLQTAVADWNPRKKRQSQQLPHTWLFPWLPFLPSYQLDAKGSGLLADVKRKIRQLVDGWEFERGVVPGLQQWQDVLGGEWRPMIMSHVLPSMAKYLQTKFRVDPADQEPYLPVLLGAMQWRAMLGDEVMGEMVVQNVMPMWMTKLQAWLALEEADLGEVADWYGWWRGVLLKELARTEVVRKELDRGMRIMNMLRPKGEAGEDQQKLRDDGRGIPSSDAELQWTRQLAGKAVKPLPSGISANPASLPTLRAASSALPLFLSLTIRLVLFLPLSPSHGRGTVFSWCDKAGSQVKEKSRARPRLSASEPKPALHEPSPSVPPSPVPFVARRPDSGPVTMFWRFGGYANISTIDTILDKPDFTLEELLDEGDLIQELKQNNSKLIQYLREEKVLSKLLDYVVAPKLEPVETPEEPAAADDDGKGRSRLLPFSRPRASSRADDSDGDEHEKRRNRYALVASEILSSETWSICEALTDNRDLIRNFWLFLSRPAPLDPLQASYFTKVNESLFEKKTEDMMLLFRSLPNVVPDLLSHVECPMIMDLLLKILALDRSDHPSCIRSHYLLFFFQWLYSKDIIPRLLSCLDPSHSWVVQTAAGDFIKAIITISANASQNEQQCIGPNELTRQLVSRPCVERLISYMLGGGNPLTVGVGIVIEVIRKNNSDYDPDFGTEANAVPSGRDPIYLGTLLRLFAENVPNFMNLIMNGPSRGQGLASTFGEKLEPLGFDRFKTCELMAELLHCSNMGLLNEVGSEQLIASRDAQRQRLRAEGKLWPQKDEDQSADDLTMRLPQANAEEARRLEITNADDDFEEVEPSREMSEDTSHEFVKAEDDMPAAPPSSFLERDDDDFMDEPLASPQPPFFGVSQHRPPLDDPELMVAPLSPSKVKPPRIVEADATDAASPQQDSSREPEERAAGEPSKLAPPELTSEMEAAPTSDLGSKAEAGSTECDGLSPHPEDTPPPLFSAPDGARPETQQSEAAAPSEPQDGRAAAPETDAVQEEEMAVAATGEQGDETTAEAAVGDFLKMQFVDYHVVPAILQQSFFFGYPWNNFLHNVVYDVVQQVFNGPMGRGFNPTLAVSLFEAADITAAIIKGQQTSDVSQAQTKTRMGYMGHLTLIAEEVVKFTERHPPELLSEMVLDKVMSQDWINYVEGALAETRERDNAILGGVRPELAMGHRGSIGGNGLAGVGLANLGTGAGPASNALAEAGLNGGLEAAESGGGGNSIGPFAISTGTLMSGFGSSSDEDDDEGDGDEEDVNSEVSGDSSEERMGTGGAAEALDEDVIMASPPGAARPGKLHSQPAAEEDEPMLP
ncbi:hypothetical protein L249_8376 [Ophiocordyceps polyrhachis-furcata BCC 54312]|uniref:G-patch domain-containing protein n=1 Tax=Ophiocordyceps polyrhachis-furcata BCC 54312 TaxID=1330021 RepID=A0A367L676_9HYPO|nr:hypothetical protein L249_8376 [Ophiocordyceps polyrhachis-furcata BCC 54312]